MIGWMDDDRMDGWMERMDRSMDGWMERMDRSMDG